MRNHPIVKAERYRIRTGFMASNTNNGIDGVFKIPYGSQVLVVIATDGVNNDPDSRGWDHVSVSLSDRCPTWQEMCFVKELFFRDDECVMQLHPPKKDWVNDHPYCLHLWRPLNQDIPRPPSILVGPGLLSPKGVNA